MTVGERIKAVLTPLGLPVKPDIYKGDKVEYLTYNYSLMPAQHADGRPLLLRALVQVHLFCPRGANRILLTYQVAELLGRGGFTWPEVQNVTAGTGSALSDDKSQHWVFECETLTTIAKQSVADYITEE